jgi:hypothetical protein
VTPSPAASSGTAASARSDALSRRREALSRRRELLQRELGGRFWLRVHASFIVSGTFAAGFVANLALLQLGLHALLPRWLAAIAVGYGAFFVLVRLWLAYIGVHAARSRARSDGADAIDWTPGSDLDVPFRGGGGRFGGGGASGDFGTAAPRLVGSARPAGGSAGVGLDIGDSDGFLVIVIGVIVLALVAVLAGSALHFIWMAPELLTDAAFGALLASGALPGLRRLDEPGWGGSVLRATWKPLMAVVVVAMLAALVLRHYFPLAHTIGAAWRSLG